MPLYGANIILFVLNYLSINDCINLTDLIKNKKYFKSSTVIYSPID